MTWKEVYSTDFEFFALGLFLLKLVLSGNDVAVLLSLLTININKEMPLFMFVRNVDLITNLFENAQRKWITVVWLFWIQVHQESL